MAALSADSARKRGRPRLYPEELERSALGKLIFEECESRRSRHEAFYVQEAYAALFMGTDNYPEEKRKQDFGWFILPNGKLRSTILAELGRIGDGRLLGEAARYICEHKPKAREAVALIRQWRGVRRDPPPGRLFAGLAAVLNSYMAANPQTTWEQVRGVLCDLSNAVARAEEADNQSEE